MKLSCVTLSFFFFLSSTCWCQICADSSYHLRYDFPEHFDANQQVQLNDGGRLIEGGLQSIKGSLLTRFDRYNNILWSKEITAGSSYLSLGIKSIEETAAGPGLTSLSTEYKQGLQHQSGFLYRQAIRFDDSL